MTGEQDSNLVRAGVLGMALDEIYYLRRGFAHEGILLRGHLDRRAFPASRRGIAEAQVERMLRAARGDLDVYDDQDQNAITEALKIATAGSTSLTRYEWERARGLR